MKVSVVKLCMCVWKAFPLSFNYSRLLEAGFQVVAWSDLTGMKSPNWPKHKKWELRYGKVREVGRKKVWSYVLTATPCLAQLSPEHTLSVTVKSGLYTALWWKCEKTRDIKCKLTCTITFYICIKCIYNYFNCYWINFLLTCRYPS